MKKHIYFPSFYKTVRSVVQGCDVSQKYKPKTTCISGEMGYVISIKPLEKILVDIYGPFPTGQFRYFYILVVLHNFTRYVKLYPSCKATAQTCVKQIVHKFILSYGCPCAVVSDHERQFISKVWQRNLPRMVL